MFYYFYILAAADPVNLLRSYIIKSNNFDVYYFSIISVLLVFSLPKLNIKYKLAVLLSIMTYFILDPYHIKILLIFNLLQFFIMLYFINNIINEWWNDKDIKFFMVILIIQHLFLIIKRYLFYTDINTYLNFYTYFLLLDIFYTFIIVILGPHKGFSLNIKWLDKLTGRRKIIVYGNGNQTFDLSDLIKYGLTEREIEVLKLISQGYTSKEIAEKLYLSKKTIDYYRSNIRAKLNLSKKSEIIRFLKERNFISEPNEIYQTK
ncbi:response regulator transcription factor [Rosettibacter firmus]|uniref:response regulator transcription factor n=1 Tax=Rosettibacter firmus TaxID=3111522 RepID=UPI00336BDCEB